MDLTLDPIMPWPSVVAAAVGLFTLVWLLYRPRVAPLGSPWSRILLTLRLIVALLLIGLMLRPAVEFVEPDDRPQLLLLLADSSKSMTVADAGDGLRRRNRLLQIIADAEPAFDAAERVKPILIDFGENASVVEQLTAEADGGFTDVAAALAAARDQVRGGRVAALVMLTDGAIRTAEPSSERAVGNAQLFAEDTGAAVNSVVFGSSDLQNRGLDLAIEDVLVEPVAFEKKTVPVRATVRLSGFGGRTAVVRVRIEDRTGVEVGLPGELADPPAGGGASPAVEIKADSADVTIPVDLSFVAERPGDYKLQVEVQFVEGELRAENNVRESLITVRKGGLRVAYFDSARWEQRFITGVNETSQIQLDSFFVADADSLRELLSAADWLEEDRYDVFLLGDVPSEVLFGADREFANGLARRIARGAGLGIIAGESILSARPRGRLAGVLPVDYDGARVDERADGFRLRPTPTGLSHFVMRLGQESLFDELPPLERVFAVRPVNEAVDVLAESDDGVPLVIAAETGGGRVLVNAMADTWLWYRAGHPETHQRFWQQVLLWLGRKDEDSRAGLTVRAEPRQVDRGQPVRLSVANLNDDGEPIQGSRLEVTVLAPDGTEQKLPVGGASGRGEISYENTLEPGDYWVTATATRDDEAPPVSANTRFLVNDLDAELDNPAADPAMLEQIAAVTGGVVIQPEQFDGWLTELLETAEESDASRRSVTTLWDGWPPLLLICGLLFAEWTVRKSRGLV